FLCGPLPATFEPAQARLFHPARVDLRRVLRRELLLLVRGLLLLRSGVRALDRARRRADRREDEAAEEKFGSHLADPRVEQHVLALRPPLAQEPLALEAQEGEPALEVRARDAERLNASYRQLRLGAAESRVGGARDGESVD